MIFHQFFQPILPIVLLLAVVIRVVTAPFRMGRWYRRRRYWGYDGYPNPYGPPLLAVLAIIAFERLFGRRYY